MIMVQVSTIKNMKDYESIFENLHTSFVTGLSIYRHSCEELLSPLMLPDNKFHELLENSDRNAWEDEELGKSLCERLGADYLPYKSSVKKLNKKIILFSKKLKLDDMRVGADRIPKLSFDIDYTLLASLGCKERRRRFERSRRFFSKTPGDELVVVSAPTSMQHCWPKSIKISSRLPR
ncbi:hypothetical protein K440DRAFT_366847 [Wilcoxina mikolae CBS 423.85]|nr:hypothetical protein K440DRAFT_366847 [Wilcoxina mikolae CBS 423.85]